MSTQPAPSPDLQPDGFFSQSLADADPAVFAGVRHELGREQTQIELIASENIVSKAVLEAQGSVFTNKYAEGYPGKRYYQGCAPSDEVETLAIERAKQLFGCGFANVQPHSGRTGERRRHAGADQAWRHHPGHEPRCRRPPDPRRARGYERQMVQCGSVWRLPRHAPDRL
jgi:hypothetical protein